MFSRRVNIENLGRREKSSEREKLGRAGGVRAWQERLGVQGAKSGLWMQKKRKG